MFRAAKPTARWCPWPHSFEGKRLNSPNDLVFDSQGALYFTDPPYGLPGTFKDPAKELPFQGVYRVAKDGKVTLVAKELEAPNGLAFSPDYKTLYVANSQKSHADLEGLPVNADGSLGAGRVFADSSKLYKEGDGVPDGLKVDVKGNVFATGPGGVLDLHARRHPARPHPHRRAHRQCGVWRRRRDAVHHGQSSRAAHAHQDRRACRCRSAN